MRSSSSFFDCAVGLAAALLFVSADAVLGDHVDAVLDQVRVEAGDLLLGDLHLLQRRRDLLEGQVAALAAQRDQAAQLLDLGDRALLAVALHDVG